MEGTATYYKVNGLGEAVGGRGERQGEGGGAVKRGVGGMQTLVTRGRGKGRGHRYMSKAITSLKKIFDRYY